MIVWIYLMGNLAGMLSNVKLPLLVAEWLQIHFITTKQSLFLFRDLRILTSYQGCQLGVSLV